MTLLLVCYVDGSGDGRISYFIEGIGGTVKTCPSAITHNQAEYCSLLTLLEDYPDDDLHIFSDSMLVVNQVNREWKINNFKLKELAERVWSRMERRLVILDWIPREYNKAGKLLEENTIRLSKLDYRDRRRELHREKLIEKLLGVIKGFGYLPDGWTVTELRSLVSRLKYRNEE